MILSTAAKANNIVMFKLGQKMNKIMKCTFENKNNHSNHSKINNKQQEIKQIQSNVMHPKERKIEIKLNVNQINNANDD